MNGIAATRHGVDVALLTLAFAGAASLGLLVLQFEVPPFVLPAAAAIAAGVQWQRRRHVIDAPDGHAWLLVAIAAILLATATIVGWGALATTSRFWDGAVMWDLKTGWLTERLSLDQPGFADPGVLCHSRDYPLLQPLLAAMLTRNGIPGRLLFPALYLLQAALVFLGSRRAGAPGWSAGLLAFAWGLTPMVMNPTSGSFDSGYADAFLAIAVTATVAGMVAGDRLWVATGIVLAVWVKPEGLAYGGVAVLLTWLGRDRNLLGTALVAWTGALVLWLPLQLRLQHPGNPTPALPVVASLGLLATIAAVLFASHHRCRAATRRTRFVVLLAMLAGCVVAIPVALAILGGSTSTLAAYAGGPTRVLEHLDRLPAIAFGLLDQALLRGQFGVAFVLPIVAAVGIARTRCRQGPALAWLAAMVVVVHLPFLLSPLDDLHKHLRSTMPRLLFHHLGACFVAAGTALAAANARRAGVHSM